jgi:hypothetical protein
MPKQKSFHGLLDGSKRRGKRGHGAEGKTVAMGLVERQGRIVTSEEPVPPNPKKVKLPDVTDVFGVESVSLYKVLNELEACFG